MGVAVGSRLSREKWQAWESELQPLMGMPEDLQREQQEAEEGQQRELHVPAGDVPADGG